MKCLCNLTTKKIETYIRNGDIDFNPVTHVVLDVTTEPDLETDRLNDDNNGLRPATSQELTSDGENKKDILISQELELNNLNINKAIALTVLDEINLLRVNAGLQERTVRQFKAAVKARLL